WCEGEGERNGGARPVQRAWKECDDVGAAHRRLQDGEGGNRQQQRQPGRGAKRDGVEGPASADDRDRREGKEHVLAEAAERGAEEDGYHRQRHRELPGSDATPSTVRQEDVDHDQQQQGLEVRIAVDERGGKDNSRPCAPGERVTNHGPRLLRLTAPSVTSRIATLPNASQGPSAVEFGGCAGGPVDVSTALGCGESDGASASRLVDGAGVAVGTGVASFDA